MNVRDESQWDTIQDSKRGKSVDMQNELRGFYQNIRDSEVAYTTTQTKNPFTMLWATSPSPKRERSDNNRSLNTTSQRSKIGY